jgi:hypothetical protein
VSGQGRRGGKFSAGGGTAGTTKHRLQFRGSSDSSSAEIDAEMSSNCRSGSEVASSSEALSSTDCCRGPLVGRRHGSHGSRSGGQTSSGSGGERRIGSESGSDSGSSSGRGKADSSGPDSNGRGMQARLSAIDERMVQFAQNNRCDLELLTITRSAIAAVSLLCT